MQLRSRFIFSILFLFCLPTLGISDVWDCEIIKHHDDTENEIFQIYIKCDPDGTSGLVGADDNGVLRDHSFIIAPSLDSEEKDIYLNGTNEEKDILQDYYVEKFHKVEWAEKVKISEVSATILVNRKTFEVDRKGRENSLRIKILAMPDGPRKTSLMKFIGIVP
jgi:hypothetical protein